jgi:hypothetical protein
MAKRIIAGALAALLLAALPLSGCRGRTANPTPTIMPGDRDKDCDELEAAMSEVDGEARRLFGKHDKTVSENWGIFLIGLAAPPLWLMADGHQADKAEAEALKERFAHLQALYEKNDCAE